MIVLVVRESDRYWFGGSQFSVAGSFPAMIRVLTTYI